MIHWKPVAVLKDDYLKDVELCKCLKLFATLHMYWKKYTFDSSHFNILLVLNFCRRNFWKFGELTEFTKMSSFS